MAQPIAVGVPFVSHRSPSQPHLSQLFRWMLPSIVLGFVSCTLTGDDFEPARVEALTNLPPDTATEGMPEGCGAGAQCCASLPCAAGQLCLGGECQSAPISAAPDAGACPGGDCSPPEVLVPEMLPPQAAPPTCDDRLLNGDESAVACGGP